MLGATAAATVLSPGVCAQTEERTKPNIIAFLVDDMGWMDSSIYGSEYYKTANMARLARESVRFTDGYAANPLCSPTRASLMTGKYPARLRFTTPGGHLPELGREPGLTHDRNYRKSQKVESRRILPLEERTIAEAAKEEGYKTCFIGKWHLGKSKQYWPEYQGFDVNLGGTGSPGPPGGYFDPYANARLENRKEGEYVTDRLTDEAIGFIESNKEEPFFLCLWHFGVHGPWGHKEEITEKFLETKDPRGEQGNPVMASMLLSIDESLGRLLDTLEELGIDENTIVMFLSDNGGNIHSDVGGKPPTNNAPLRGGKASIYEGGTRVPMLVKWPGVIEAGSTCAAVVSSIDIYPTVLDMIGAKRNESQIIETFRGLDGQ